MQTRLKNKLLRWVPVLLKNEHRCLLLAFRFFFSSADCTFYTNNDFFFKKQKQFSFKDQSLWRGPQYRADGSLVDAFLCFMFFPSIFKENGILMNDCCINLGWRSTWWSLSTSSSNSLTLTLNQEGESIHVQEEQCHCCWWKGDVDGTIEKLYDADPSAAREERSQKKQNSTSSCFCNIWAPTLTLWDLWDGRNKLHGPIGWRTCLILPGKSRGSLRSHIRSCWSSSRVRITKLAGLKWIKERHSCFPIHLTQLCVGLCVYVRLSENTQQLFGVFGSLLLPGATHT